MSPSRPAPAVSVDIVLLTLGDTGLQVALHRRDHAPANTSWRCPAAMCMWTGR